MRNNLALLFTLCLGIFNVTLYGTEEFYSLCEKNDQESARRYIREHPAYVTQTYKGKLPLHIASFYGLIDIVRDLITNDSVAYHATVAPDGEIMTSGFNALHLAAAKGHHAIVDFLLRQSTISHNRIVTGNSKGFDGFNALHIAAGQGHLTVVECLLRQSTIRHDSVVTGNSKGFEGFNALHLAARFGHHAIVECLLKQSTMKHDSVVTGNTGIPEGLNALHMAAYTGYPDIVTTIIDSGKIHHDLRVAATNTHGLTGLSPLNLAVHQGKLATTKSLVYAGATLSDYALPTALTLTQAERYCHQTGAITQGLIPLVDSLRAGLAQCQELINQQRSTLTPALSGHIASALIRALITGGADIDYYDTAGRTLLHAAMGPGNPDQAMSWDELAKWLISHKQNLLIAAGGQQEGIDRELSRWTSKPARCGSTPLSMAAHYNNRRTVFLLLNKKPSTHALYSAVQECAACNHDMLRKIFLRAAYGPSDTSSSVQTHKRTTPDDTTPTDDEGTQKLIAKKQRL